MISYIWAVLLSFVLQNTTTAQVVNAPKTVITKPLETIEEDEFETAEEIMDRQVQFTNPAWAKVAAVKDLNKAKTQTDTAAKKQVG